METSTKINFYNSIERKLLENYSYKSLKLLRNFYILFTFIFCIILITDVVKISANLNNNLGNLIIITLVHVIFALYALMKLLQYYVLIEKLELISNPEINFLIPECIQKVNICKTSIDNKESYYVVHKYYNDLRKFLIINEDFLPIEICEQAKKDLKIIESELIYCD